MRGRVAIQALTFLSALLLLCASAAAIDGVILIDQARALAGGITPGDTPGFPISISVAGSYRLSGNLTVPADTDGISIFGSATTVTIDLNGFEINGGGGTTGTGIFEGIAGGEVTVKNGTIRGMGQDGISATNEPGRAIVTDVQVLSNNRRGIYVRGTAIVTRCMVLANDQQGIMITTTNGSALITDNLVRSNGVGATTYAGISVGKGLVRGNTVTDNGDWGLYVSFDGEGHTDPAGYYGNVFADNNGGNSNPQIYGGFNLGNNLCGVAVCAP